MEATEFERMFQHMLDTLSVDELRKLAREAGFPMDTMTIKTPTKIRSRPRPKLP